VCGTGIMSALATFKLPIYVSVTCGLLMTVIADIERVQHAGHVHTAHEVDGKHNVEFDHEAILGTFCRQCICHHFITNDGVLMTT